MANGVRPGTAAALERLEVVPTDQMPRPIIHGRFIKGAVDMPGVLTAYRPTHRLIADPVVVDFPAAVKTGMKRQRDMLAGPHDNVGGKQAVHSSFQFFRAQMC